MKFFLLLHLVSLFSLVHPLRAEEGGPVPVRLRLWDGGTRKGDLTAWADRTLRIQDGAGTEEEVALGKIEAILLQPGSFGFVQTLDENAKGWDISHFRMSSARWVEGVGWRFEDAFSRRLRTQLPKQGRLPLEVEAEIDFGGAAPGFQLYLYPTDNPTTGRGPFVHFKFHQGWIFCGSTLNQKNGVSHRFPVPKDHEGPWTVRIRLDPEENQYRVDLNGKELVSWKEADGVVPPDQAFLCVDGILTVKTPVDVKTFEIRMAGQDPDGDKRRPPYVELANGDVLPMRAVGWDGKAIQLQSAGADPIPVPAERILSVWFAKPDPEP